MLVTLSVWFPTKREFRTTQPKMNFARNWVISQSGAKYKQSREDRKGKASVTQVPSVWREIVCMAHKVI
jgi:hypothetical protein